MQHFSFNISGMKFTIPILSIKEIITYREPSKFFSSNTSVVGMIQLRDKVITIIDPKILFNSHGESEPSHIIIVDMDNDEYLGVIVDEVSDIITTDDSEKVDSQSVLGDKSKYIDYIINQDGKLYNNLSMEILREIFNGND